MCGVPSYVETVGLEEFLVDGDSTGRSWDGREQPVPGGERTGIWGPGLHPVSLHVPPPDPKRHTQDRGRSKNLHHRVSRKVTWARSYSLTDTTGCVGQETRPSPSLRDRPRCEWRR